MRDRPLRAGFGIGNTRDLPWPAIMRAGYKMGRGLDGCLRFTV
jgi:hypothetical protein